MADKLKIGIIGCGGIANGKHMPSLKKIGEVEMVAFCDIIEERAVKACEEYGASFFANGAIRFQFLELLCTACKFSGACHTISSGKLTFTNVFHGLAESISAAS